MECRSHRRFFALTLTLLALAGFGASAYAMALESWDQKITDASRRFKVQSDFNNQAVLDRETGLVWETSPAPTTHNWINARPECTSRTTGGRKGWRLPSIPELMSLVDPANSNPALPTGHPFLNVQSAFYWSATTDAGNPTSEANPQNPSAAWLVNFQNGDVHSNDKIINSYHAWCVRGGMNADQY